MQLAEALGGFAMDHDGKRRAARRKGEKGNVIFDDQDFTVVTEPLGALIDLDGGRHSVAKGQPGASGVKGAEFDKALFGQLPERAVPGVALRANGVCGGMAASSCSIRANSFSMNLVGTGAGSCLASTSGCRWRAK